MKTKILLATAVACFYFATVSMAQTVPSYVPTNGLVGWWPFNGNANDESGNGNNGTVYGATLTTDRNGQINCSYNFNVNNWSFGSGGDYIYVPYNPSFNFSDFTISTWIKRTSDGATIDFPNQSLSIIRRYQYGYNNPNGETWVLEVAHGSSTNGSLVFGSVIEQSPSPATSFYSQSNQIVPLNQWCNITMTYTQNTIKLYINNQLVGMAADPNVTINTVGNSGISIGLSDQANGHWNPFDGSIDDIGIWNRALSQQEITALYQSNNCSVPAYVPTNGLVGYWPFCGNANDVSGNGNNGTVNGATLTTDRNGNANEAYDFDGANDFIDIAIPQNTSFTVSAWFSKENTSSGIAGIFQHKDSCARGAGYIFELQNNSIRYQGINCGQCGNICPNFFDYSNIQSVNQNIWYHALITCNSSGLYNIYLNGQIVYSFTNPNTLAQFNVPFSIGKHHDGSSDLYFFNGKIDDIGMWNRALNQQEITSIYTSGCTKPEPVSLGTNASTRLCPSESVTIEIVTPADSANYTYQWTRNGTNMVGATTRSITVNDAAKYKVFVSSGPVVDCRRVSGLVETTPSIPPTVVATAPNGTSYCPGDSVLMTATGATAGYSYRWKRFGVVIPGANSNTFYATQTGNYRCEIYNAGGCITQSNLISITNGTSCRIMEQTNSDVSVYPNPAQNAFTVSFNDIGNETPVSVSLRSMQGQVIEQRNIAGKEDVQFAVTKLAPGLYVVIIQLESSDSIEKTVVVE